MTDITVTLPREQWESVCKAIYLGLKNKEIAKDEFNSSQENVEETENNRHMEPIAWGMPHSDGNLYDIICPEEHAREEGEYTIPLYTKPQNLTLSDEEILEQALFSFGNESENFNDSYWIDFARAILKKASDK